MSEPYEADECPACGSENTGAYYPRSALMQGFSARCYNCGAIWQFPSVVDPDTPVIRSLADQAFHSRAQTSTQLVGIRQPAQQHQYTHPTNDGDAA